jgi:hypothetical protein
VAGQTNGNTSELNGALQGAKAGAAFGPYGAAVGAVLGLALNSPQAPGSRHPVTNILGSSLETTTATNAINANDVLFTPSVNVQLGGGIISPSNTGGLSSSLPITQNPITNPVGSTPFPNLYGIPPAGSYGTNGIPPGTTLTGQGVAANLSGNTIIMIAAIGLLLVMAMSKPHHKKKRS